MKADRFTEKTQYITENGKTYTVITDNLGTITWHLGNIIHRESGPARLTKNGDHSWYINGLLHREKGPACEYINGTKIWYVNGKMHRTRGPARIEKDGEQWYFNGKLHRHNGPAVTNYKTNLKKWYYHGTKMKCSTQKGFDQLLKLISFW